MHMYVVSEYGYKLGIKVQGQIHFLKNLSTIRNANSRIWDIDYILCFDYNENSRSLLWSPLSLRSRSNMFKISLARNANSSYIFMEGVLIWQHVRFNAYRWQQGFRISNMNLEFKVIVKIFYTMQYLIQVHNEQTTRESPKKQRNAAT